MGIVTKGRLSMDLKPRPSNQFFGEWFNKYCDPGGIELTLYDKQPGVESLIAGIVPLSQFNSMLQVINLLYLPTGVQTKEGFEYKFVRPLRN